jgi:ribosomal peptide maturation radical SAM protein 1
MNVYVQAPRTKPIALVSMPTLSARYPCYQLGLLKPTLERAGFEVENHSLYMYFGSFVGWRLHEVLSEVWPSLIGEWIWARAAFGEFADDEEYFEAHRENLKEVFRLAGCRWKDLVRVRDRATREFLDFCLERTDWSRYGLVGFTVLFQQQLATVAMARALKERYPRLPIALGGGIFEDDIAQAFLRGCPQIDFVHCGDADETFPEIVRRLYAGEPLRGLPGVQWRDGDRIAFEGRAANHLDMSSTPVPDYDEYFRARVEGGYASYSGAEEPMIPIETARGCWWGEKSHCTFCGLNRSGMEFRAKDVPSVLAMLEELAARHGALSFNAIDNIIAPIYVDELFGALAQSRTDLEIHYEVKANLRREQIARMRLGGLFSVQPGVESFSTHILRLMKKGTTGMRNLELVKWCTYYGVINLYNLLVGFSGETAQDYEEQRAIIAKIPHLQPPYTICRARPDRGSPMFTAPREHGITALRPAACYRFLFPGGRFELASVSYYFEHEMEGTVGDDVYAPMFAEVAEWKRRWEGDGARPFLRYRKAWDALTIEDGRGTEVCAHRVAGLPARLYELCADARSAESIAEEVGGGPWVEAALRDFLARGLMVRLDDRYLSLALPAYPYFGLEVADRRRAVAETATERAPLHIVRGRG